MWAAMLKMKTDRLNYEYFRIFKQFPVMFVLKFKRKKSTSPTRRILIVNNSLIGEFLMSLPALKHFIDNNKEEVDLVVSPIVEPLAKHIKGVQKVFTSKSTYNRATEKKEDMTGLRNYGLVLIMQTNGEIYKTLKNVNYNKVKTSIKPFFKYGLHIVKNLSKKENLKQFEDFSFETVQMNEICKKKIEFDDIFKFDKEDYEKARKMPFMKKGYKKVVIHTGSGWTVKLWKNERWVELLEKINKMGKFKFIFVGGTDREENDFNQIKEKLGFEIRSIIKKADIKDTALIMRECDFFIGVDSGPRNLAHLLGIPSICLLGPGPKLFSPKNRNAVLIDKSNCYCTNLFCYRKEPCVVKITVDDIIKEFEKLSKR